MDLSADSELEENFTAEEDFRRSGEEIMSLLKQGIEISDDVYVRLFVAKLRITYPYKSKKTLRRELKSKVQKEREITARIQAVENEIQELTSQDDLTAGGNRRRRRKDPN